MAYKTGTQICRTAEKGTEKGREAEGEFNADTYWKSKVRGTESSKYWDELVTQGITSVPMGRLEDAGIRSAVLQEVLHSVRHSPELKAPIPAGQGILVTLGGFGGLGTTSSFHFPIIRKLRGEILTQLAAKVFCHAPRDYKVEPLADRLCLRLPKQTPQEEAGHRDITPHPDPTSIITGGWLNLSAKTQRFSCVPGTQYFKLRLDAKGFATFPLQQIIEENPDKQLKKVAFECPPGYFIIFNQLIGHEVLANPAEEPYDKPYAKLFMGFRLTRTDYRLMDKFLEEDKKTMQQDRANALRNGLTPPEVFGNMLDLYKAQGLPYIPSKQKPPVYGKNHASSFKSKTFAANSSYKGVEGPITVDRGLTGFGDRFIDAIPRTNLHYTEKTTPQSVIVRFFPSLESIGKKLEEYTPHELEVAAGGPRESWNRVWTLNDRGEWVQKDVHLRRHGGFISALRRRRKNRTKRKERA